MIRNPELGSGRSRGWRLTAYVRRGALSVFALGQTLVASYYMLTVLPYHGGTAVEKAITLLFGLLFLWISLGFWTAIFGFVVRRFGRDPHSLLGRHSETELARVPLCRTAIVMPIYHEPVERCLRGLYATYRSLEQTGNIAHFDFFILSDSRDPEIWLSEQAAWYDLCQELGAFGRIFYRRRSINLRHKSGNIADFLRRWGSDYRYLIVLDADSLMGGDTLVRMVQLMELEPRVGIVQTSPSIVNALSPFARVQQFGNAAYGPLFTAGLAAIQLGEAAFWGHNAIIRAEPFRRHCGLRALPAFGLFRGPILSHDFVEAAYMGRAGYEVWLEPELAASYEESPPSIVDELARDRRWAKGNLQHLWLLLFGRGIRFAHRVVFLNGIMSYLASPLWLAFLILTTVEATQLVLRPIDYFPSDHAIFPLWPEWHPEWAIGLAGSTAVLLFLPKLLAAIDILLSGRARSFGGFARLNLSILFEILLSTLLAPIRMLAHSRFVAEAVLSLSLQWAGQNRTAQTKWSTALVSHAPSTLLGIGWAAFALWLKPLFFFWSLPIALPIALGAPTSVLLGRFSLGQRLRNLGLLVVQEEITPPRLLEDLRGSAPTPPGPRGLLAFEKAVIDPRLNAVHVSLARHLRSPRRQLRLQELRALCLRDGPRALTRGQLTQLAQDAQSLTWLHRAAWRAPAGSYWAELLDAGRSPVHTEARILDR